MSDELARTDAPIALDRVTLGELLGYAGAATSLVALSVLVVAANSDTPSKWVVGSTAGLAAAGFLVAGLLLGRPDDKRSVRFRSVLWFLSAQALFDAMFSVLASNGGADLKSNLALSALVTAVYAAALWWWSRQSLQQIALFLAALAALLTVAFPDVASDTFGFPDFTPLMLVAIGSGLVWLGLGWRGVIAPRRTAMVLGAVTMSFSPYFLSFRGDRNATGAVFAFVGVGLLVGGHLARDRAISGIGVVDVLAGSALVVGVAVQGSFGEGSTGRAAAALVIGLVMLAGAIWLMRPRAAAATPPDAPAATPGEPPPPPPPPPDSASPR